MIPLQPRGFGFSTPEGARQPVGHAFTRTAQAQR
jgi:hypothetical protein